MGDQISIRELTEGDRNRYVIVQISPFDHRSGILKGWTTKQLIISYKSRGLYSLHLVDPERVAWPPGFSRPAPGGEAA